MRAIFTTLERKRKPIPAALLRSVALGETVARKHWDALASKDDVAVVMAGQDIEKDLAAGRTTPDEALKWVTAAYNAGWDDFDVGGLGRAAVRERDLSPILKRVRGKRTAQVRLLKGRAVKYVIVHPSTRRGPHPFQISRLDAAMTPIGHMMWRGSIEDALRDVWKEYGPFELMDVSEAALREARRVVRTRMPRKSGQGSPGVRYDWEGEKGFQEDDVLTLYHGFRNWHDALIAGQYGLSGKDIVARVYSYEQDNNPAGLFVTLDLESAKEFTGAFGPAVIVEFAAKFSELEAPVWPGGGFVGQGQFAPSFGGLDKREAARLAARAKAKESDLPVIAMSSRPELAATLLGREFQALFVGDLNANRIRAFWVKDPDESGRQSYRGSYKRLGRTAFLKAYGSTKLTYDQLRYAAGGLGATIKSQRVRVGGFKPQDEWDVEKFVRNIAAYMKAPESEAIETVRDMARDRPERTAHDYLWPKQQPGFIAWAKGLKEAVVPTDSECQTCRRAGRGSVPATTMRKGAWRVWSYLCQPCADRRDESLDEAMPASARTTFDSAPYANMRLLDVARLLVGASSASTPNVSLITKLVDRLVHALEFTIYSIQGRPEGRRIGNMIRKSFNNLTTRLPELVMSERREAASAATRLNEAVELLDLGPVEPSAR